jgi:alpha-galactosidase
MDIYDRVEMAMELGGDGTSRLIFKAKTGIDCVTPMLELGRVTIQAICDLSGEGAKDAAQRAGRNLIGLSSRSERFVLMNGWQSWSFGGEIQGRERPRRAFYKRDLNLFVDHPAEAAVRDTAKRSGAVVSHFFTVLRTGDLRLALVSDNVDREADRILPPLTFFVGEDWIEIHAYAEGGHFRKGETVARVAVVPAADYFELKDRLAVLFAAPGRFENLAFLSGGAEGGYKEDIRSTVRPTPIGGFETWYNHYLDINESVVLDDLGSIGANGNLLRAMFIDRDKPLIFQIDDGWERCVGDWRPEPAKFPAGMAKIARSIEEKGYIPGLWLAPFLVMPESPVFVEHPEWILRDTSDKPVKAGWNPGWGGAVYCLDLSMPEVEVYILSLFDTVIEEWGYRYLKLDFLYAGLLRGRRKGGVSDRGGAGGADSVSGADGVWENYVRILDRITSRTKDSRGRAIAYLSCGAPFETTAPFMPLMRIGADTLERWDWYQLKLIGHQGRPSAKVNLGHTFARAILDKTLLLNDPDVVFCRTARTSLRDHEKFLIGLSAFMFASQIMFSDDPSEFGRDEEGRSRGKPCLGEKDFTEELLSLYDRLRGHEFGIERLDGPSRELYRFFARDGAIFGCVNLSDRDRITLLDAYPYIGVEPRPAMVPAHSMLVFGLDAEISIDKGKSPV